MEEEAESEQRTQVSRRQFLDFANMLKDTIKKDVVDSGQPDQEPSQVEWAV